MNLKAEIIAIGTELLIGHVVNTNASYLSEELNALGISTYFHTTVGDNPERIKLCLDLACSRSDLVIITGGLGPTSDDITHEVISDFTKIPLFESPELRQLLLDKFQAFNRSIPEINFRQALVPETSVLIPNPTGTATGIILKHKQATLITFPGVPSEMKNMFENSVKAFLLNEIRGRSLESVIISRKIKFFNIGESHMAEILGDDIFNKTNPSIAPYANLGECYVRITAKAQTQESAETLMQPVISEIENKMQKYIYAYDEDTVISILAKYLIEKKLTIAFAESCTGGLLAKAMTDIPGSSSYFKIGVITYSNEAKTDILKVKAETLLQQGAVSMGTASEMAIGLSRISKSDINVSITGIAGPDGGTTEKPVGTIFISILLSPKNLQEQSLILNNSESLKNHKNSESTQRSISINSEDNSIQITSQLDWFARKLNREQVRELATLKTLHETYLFLHNLLK
jgi:nicotinamide-nucleotide amidase